MNKIESVIDFQKYYLKAVKFPAFEQVIEAQKINNQLRERLTELQNENERLTKFNFKLRKDNSIISMRIKEKLKRQNWLKKTTKVLNKSTANFEANYYKATCANRKKEFAILLEHKNANDKTYKQLAAEIGVPEIDLRKLIKYGLATKYQNKIAAFLKKLESSI